LFVMRVVFKLGCVLLLSGCATSWDADPPHAPSGGTGIQAATGFADDPAIVSSTSSLPPFGTRGVSGAYEYGTGYRVGVGDRITIRVADEAELSGDYTIDPSGNISLPYVQHLQVAGLTTTAIERAIAQRLRAGYLRNPQVAVQVANLRPFYIVGEVTTAGSFAYQPGMTVQNAIAIAGGYGARADEGEVLITRKSANGTNSHKVPVTTQVHPGDIIYVRERWF
jgi:polysaccharide biosynthesis/export protein